MTANKAVEQIRKEIERLEAVVHPWYGPCDGLMSDGTCTECDNLRREFAKAPFDEAREKELRKLREEIKRLREENKRLRECLGWGHARTERSGGQGVTGLLDKWLERWKKASGW